MHETVKVLLPIFPTSKEKKYFKGYVDKSDFITIYITNYSTNTELLFEEDPKNDHIIYGCCGNDYPKNITDKFYNFLAIEQKSLVKINIFKLYGKEIKQLNNCILMLYDYNSIRDTQAISNTNGDYLSKLVELISDEHEPFVDEDYKSKHRSPPWLTSSMFLQHIFNYGQLLSWLVSTIKRNKKVQVKQGNIIVAILIDIILGYIVLQMLSQEKKEISHVLMAVLEQLINFLYSLLKWLMGAPVGLKLNNAFNKMLGKYFSYHVQLWWLFLDVSGTKLDIILQIYHYVGYLGITLQTAMISDLICITTFHSYCIYVYAARLFNIQISGLVALLRLFVGRKYNPLRGGIDSCEYTNQELFVGTVAFTILLLLLPTTALYYIVFTMFRILSLAVQYLLAKLIYVVQTLPLYVVSLWITNSPKVTGNISVVEISREENMPIILWIKLGSKSIPELVKIFKPPVKVPNEVEWTNLLSNILVGKQIV